VIFFVLLVPSHLNRLQLALVADDGDEVAIEPLVDAVGKVAGLSGHIARRTSTARFPVTREEKKLKKRKVAKRKAAGGRALAKGRMKKRKQLVFSSKRHAKKKHAKKKR